MAAASAATATAVSFPPPFLVLHRHVTTPSLSTTNTNPPLPLYISNSTHLCRKRSLVKPLLVSFNPSGNFDLSLHGDEEENDSRIAGVASPPSEGRMEVVIDNQIIRSLDLSIFHAATNIHHQVEAKELLQRKIGFTINYVREDPYDTRELSEYPDIRLWFVRLDAAYPWLPVVLDWRAGELARYASMLVPHQMSMKMGLVFNPEALELFVMNKVFIVYSWLNQNNIAKPKLKATHMARMLGFGIGDQLYDLIDASPLPPS